MMVVDRAQVIKDLKHILVEELFIDIPEEEIKEEDSFTDVGLDSIGWVELVTIVEDKYGVEIEDAEDLAENSRTLGIFASYITGKAQLPAAASTVS